MEQPISVEPALLEKAREELKKKWEGKVFSAGEYSAWAATFPPLKDALEAVKMELKLQGRMFTDGTGKRGLRATWKYLAASETSVKVCPHCYKPVDEVKF